MQLEGREGEGEGKVLVSSEAYITKKERRVRMKGGY